MERLSLKEFFDASSITRTPKIYKEYRDFIITKYREDPSRRLTFTEIRKSLVGDLNLIYKVYLFLETWSLINFTAPKDAEDAFGEDSWKIRVEEGAPHGVKVVANPNSLKPVTAPPVWSNAAAAAGDGVGVDIASRLPPLASYSDVYNDILQRKKVVCGYCKGSCDAGHYECTKVFDFIFLCLLHWISFCDAVVRNRILNDNPY